MRPSTAPAPCATADELPEVRTYIWLGQALLAMLPWNVDRDVRDMIRSGTVAYELLRPLDLYNLWYCRALAWRVAPTLLRAVPLVAVASRSWAWPLPPSPASAAAWALSHGGRPAAGLRHHHPDEHLAACGPSRAKGFPSSSLCWCSSFRG